MVAWVRTESLLGIINIVYELATWQDLAYAARVGAIIDSLPISDPAIRREWDQARELLEDNKR